MSLPGVPLTDEEWQPAKMFNPELIRERCSKIGEPTSVYNCISWSLGITDRIIETPESQADFEEFYRQNGFVKCPYAEGTIDGFGEHEEGGGLLLMLHASRFHGGYCSSKRGDDMLMIHHRDGFNRSAFYGSIVTSFKPALTPATAEGLTVPVTRVEASAPEPHVRARLEKLSEQLAGAFPTLQNDFEAKWSAWTGTWGSTSDYARYESSSTRVWAKGPQWDALVAMGPKIIPQVVDKLAEPNNVIGVWLYNKLQTDASKKVSPKNLNMFYDLTNQAREIRKLYHQQVASFDRQAEAWDVHVEDMSLSSSIYDRVSGDAYEALVAMGKPVVPLIMLKYDDDRDGWWYEMLFQIEHGRESSANVVKKVEQWRYWQSWFNGEVVGAAPVRRWSQGGVYD
ncbi:hypothetical protein MMC13_003017 [Lambiella insularis]|nr:hypothetical protein [Lambiella insularis]